MKTVFILGELNVDMIAAGENAYPEWNKEKLLDSFDIVLGSSSAITASVLAGLGVDVKFVSLVGDDYFGEFCIEELNKKGVDTSFVKVDSSVKTGVTLALSTNEDRSLLTYMGAIPKLSPAHFPEDLFSQADHIHFGSIYLQEDMLNHWYQLFKEAKEHGVTTSFDTGWDPNENWQQDKVTELLPYTDLFIPSEEEFKKIFQTNTIDQAIEKLPTKRNRVIVKRGSDGSMMVNEQSKEVHVEGFKVSPVDTTGAGDSFNSGAIFSFLTEKDDKDLLTFANACGALATQRIGGASHIPTKEDVDEFIKLHKK